MKACSISSNVQRQYETYPYPCRNPEDENKRLVCTHSDYLGEINHYCFKGKRNFKNLFRVLDAGGGAGDSTIYLSEQLKKNNSQIVYVDISIPSMEICEKYLTLSCPQNRVPDSKKSCEDSKETRYSKSFH